VIRINLTALPDGEGRHPRDYHGGGGSIILIPSQLAGGITRTPAYCATKGALIQLRKVLAADTPRRASAPNTISRAAIETRRMLRRWKDMDEARKMMGPSTCSAGSAATEIARAAVYLGEPTLGLMTAATCSSTAATPPSDPRRPGMIVDIHAHYFPKGTTTSFTNRRRSLPEAARPPRRGRCGR